MVNSNSNFSIILAAGASQRMGVCKTTLPWQGRTLLKYQAEQFLLAGFTPVIVLGPHNLQRQKECPQGSQVVINPAPERGKTSSILTGLAALPLWTVLFISAVDQPRSAHVYQTLYKVHREKNASITAPSHAGKLGHPLLFSHRLLPDLKNISDATLGLRQIVQKYGERAQCKQNSIVQVEFATPEVFIDMNTPTSYQTQLQKHSLTR
ncbi:MAG: NTP transferase domain-containing protein [Cyanophyceae cyanobacterium]